MDKQTAKYTQPLTTQKFPKSGFSTLQPRDGVRLCLCVCMLQIYVELLCVFVSVCTYVLGGCVRVCDVLRIPQQANRALGTRGITDCYTIFSIKIAGVLNSFSLPFLWIFLFRHTGWFVVHLVCQKVCKVLPLSAFNKGFAGYILCRMAFC